MLLFTSCINGSREIDVPKSEHLYINAIASTSSTEVKVEADFTQPIIGESKAMERKIVLNAFCNNDPVKVKYIGTDFILELNRGLKAGDKLTLSATSENLSAVSAECEVLDAPKVLNATGEWIISENGDDKVQVKLQIEPSDEIRYYRVIIRTDWHSKTSGLPPGEYVEREIITLGNSLFPQPKDQLFNEANNAPFALITSRNETNLAFEYYDQKIENTPNDPFQLDWKYSAEVELQRISKDYYLYLLSCMGSENNNAFENPIKIHSNINGGFGIFEIYSPTIMPIEMQE